MTRSAIGLALLFLALMQPTSGRAQEQSWASLESEIRAQFAIAKARWQVREAEPIFPPTGSVRTFPKADSDVPSVSFPQTAVRARLVTLDRGKQEIYLRWMVAHELWHRHQYERHGEVLPATLSVAQRECEADIMGAAFATESLLSTLSPDMSDASQQAMRETLIEIRDAVDPGRDTNVDPEYPRVDQRRLATQIGVSLALMKRLEGPARSGDRSAQAAMAMLRGATMMEGSDFDAGVSSTCGRIVHSGSGVPNVRFGKPILDWRTTGDDPTVSFSIPVYSVGNGRIRGSFRAMTMLVRRADRDNTLDWRGLDYKDFNFELSESDGVQFLRGSLTWAPATWSGIEVRPGSEFMPSFLMPGAEGKAIGVLFNAERIWAATAAPPASGPRAQLAAFLTSLSDAALQDFSMLPCDYGRNGPAVPVRVGQPGRTVVRCKLLDLPTRFTSGERVERAGRNGTHVTFDLALLPDAAAARTSLNQLLGDIRALYPGVKLETQPLEGDRPTEFDRVFTIAGVPYLNLRVSISNLAGRGEPPEYRIALTADRD